MRAHVQRWGNSLAVRIPKSVAIEAHLADNTPVDLSLVDGKLVVAPTEPVERLEDLLAGITDENLHREVDTGAAIGREAW